jgi:hypothetical protein
MSHKYNTQNAIVKNAVLYNFPKVGRNSNKVNNTSDEA